MPNLDRHGERLDVLIFKFNQTLRIIERGAEDTRLLILEKHGSLSVPLH